MSDVEDEPQQEEVVLSDEDTEGDFEPAASGSNSPQGSHQRSLPLVLPPLPELDDLSVPRLHPQRQGSMATVKLQRRARLAEKLREIFEVKGIEEVIAGIYFND